MALDDVNSPLDREKFLDEIRRRAEEAELARIEAEELRLSSQLSDQPTASNDTPPSTLEGELCAHLENQLRDAINRDDVRRASTSYDEISLLNPRHPSLDEFRMPMQRLQGRQVEENTEGVQEVAREMPEPPRFRRGAASFIQSAQEHYHNEQYDAALADLEDAEGAEPDNGEIARLRADVLKARELATRIAEEERSREHGDDTINPFTPPPRVQTENEDSVVQKSENRTQEEGTGVAAAPAEPQRGMLAKWKTAALILLAVLGCVAAYVVYQYAREKYFPGSVRVLVLPAQTSTAEMHITDGLTEELISHLAHVPSLEIIAPHTALTLRSVERTKFIRALDPDYVLQLKAEHVGAQFAMHVSLTDGASGDQEFEQQFRASPAELAGFCAAIVPPLVASLDAQAKPSVQPSTTSAEAFDAYLRGRHALQHSDAVTLDSAASAFEQSCKADPRFSEAEAALGWTRLLQYEAAFDTSKEKLIVATYRLRRAMNLSAHNSEVFRLWGVLDYYNGDYSQAVERLTNAVQLAPSDAEAHQRLALAYVRTANVDGALREAKKATELDPNNARARESYGLLLMMTGDNETALKEFEADTHNRSASTANTSDEQIAALVATNNHESALDILRERTSKQPDDFALLYDLGRMFQLAGKPKLTWEDALDRSLQLVRQALKADSNNARAYAYLGLVETRLGDFGGGINAARRAIAKAPHNVEIRYLVARVYALQRDKLSDGFEQLSLAVKQRLVLNRLLDLDLQNLRNNPGFLSRVVQ